MSTVHEIELEQLLTDLVVGWPSDQKASEVKAAREYLCLHRGIVIDTDGHVVDTSMARAVNGADEESRGELTECWYSI